MAGQDHTRGPPVGRLTECAAAGSRPSLGGLTPAGQRRLPESAAYRGVSRPLSAPSHSRLSALPRGLNDAELLTERHAKPWID
jgi:hypothetical protein